MRQRDRQLVCLDLAGKELWNSGQDKFGLGPYLIADGLSWPESLPWLPAAVTTRLTREMNRRRRAEEALRLSYSQLEERIHERSAQLARITVSLQSEMAARRKSENELRGVSTAIEQSPVGILITDLTGSIVYANPKLCSVSGYSMDEVLGDTPASSNPAKLLMKTIGSCGLRFVVARNGAANFKIGKRTGNSTGHRRPFLPSAMTAAWSPIL